MPEVIERGDHGLFYLIDREERGIFIAASTWQEATELAALARNALVSGRGDVPKHVIHDHVSGTKITVPTPDWMTPEQRQESVARLQKHLKDRIYG